MTCDDWDDWEWLRMTWNDKGLLRMTRDDWNY